MSHQQPYKSSQSRTALAGGNSWRKLAAGGNATTGTMNAILLILDDDWLDQWQIPNLVTDRLGVCPFQDVTTASAMIGNAGNDLVALFGGNEFSAVLGVSFLTALFSFLLSRFRLRFWPLREDAECWEGWKSFAA